MSGPVVNSTAVFRQLFLDDTPFLDVRAEIEFSAGRFPTSYNAPILTTGEREQVGTCYKQQGQQAAIALGHQLVSGAVKQGRIDAWAAFAGDHPRAHLYCWRGGMRSNITQQWLRDAGVDIPLIAGGYKALRHVLIDKLDDTAGYHRRAHRQCQDTAGARPGDWRRSGAFRQSPRLQFWPPCHAAAVAGRLRERAGHRHPEETRCPPGCLSVSGG